MLITFGLLMIAAPSLAQDSEHYFLDPMGPIARAQRSELIWAAAIISIAVLPVIVCTPWVYWRYRRSNPKSTYTPDWAFNTKLELVQWGVPLVIVIALSVWLAQAVYLLDPYRTIDDEMAERLDTGLTGPRSWSMSSVWIGNGCIFTLNSASPVLAIWSSQWAARFRCG